MIRGTLPRSGRYNSVKTATSIVILVVAVFCLVSINTLTERHTRVSESERDAQNATSSALYVNLASLAQPITTSALTHKLLEFIRQDERVLGATLFDSQGHLLAQLGAGNDGLKQHPTHMATARVPIRSANNGLYGHAVIAFKSSTNSLNVTFHYVAITAISSMLALALAVLLFMHWTLIRTVLWRSRIHSNALDKNPT